MGFLLHLLAAFTEARRVLLQGLRVQLVVEVHIDSVVASQVAGRDDLVGSRNYNIFFALVYATYGESDPHANALLVALIDGRGYVLLGLNGERVKLVY